MDVWLDGGGGGGAGGADAALPPPPPPLVGLCSSRLDAAAADAALGAALGALRACASLDLSRNALAALPARLLSLPPPPRLAALRCLDVSRNRLAALPLSLNALVALEDLRALGNHLGPAARAVPEALRAGLLPRLARLDLRHNPRLHRGHSSPPNAGGRGCGGSAADGGGGGGAAKPLPLRDALGARLRAGALLLLSPPPPPRSARRRMGGGAKELLPGGASGDDAGSVGAADLRAQLSPLSTPTLRRRLEEAFGDRTEPGALERAELLDRLVAAYGSRGGRPPPRRLYGAPIPAALRGELLAALRATPWASLRRERDAVAAEGYITLRRPPAGCAESDLSAAARRAERKRRRHARLWDAAAAVIAYEDAVFADRYDTIAVTRCFRGSPHVDTYDLDVQYCASFGVFDAAEGKGALMVEEGTFATAAVVTKDRIACVDGRHVHWVAPYDNAKGASSTSAPPERFSVVWFRTRGAVVAKGAAVVRAQVVP